MSGYKMKIKQVRIALVLNEELRAHLHQLLSGQAECIALDDVAFEYIKVEEVKSDAFKLEELKIKRGCIKCLEIKAAEDHC